MGNTNQNCLYGHHGIQGKRPTMEDAVILNESFGQPTYQKQSLFAVFDGHNGSRCSEFLAKEFPNILLKEKDFSHNPCIALVNAFQQADKIWLESAKGKDQPMEDGSTAVCILIREHEIYVAHAGDSRAILCHDARIISLTADHKPDNNEEKQRIEKSGGYVKDGRVQGMLGVSRAFGNLSLKKYLTCYPEVKYWPITEETEFIVAACDGVWDVISNFEAANYVRTSLINGEEPSDIAKSLTDHCLGMGSTDNISIIIISFLTSEKIQKLSNSDIKGTDEAIQNEIANYSKTLPAQDKEETDKARMRKKSQLILNTPSTRDTRSLDLPRAQTSGDLRKSDTTLRRNTLGDKVEPIDISFVEIDGSDHNNNINNNNNNPNQLHVTKTSPRPLSANVGRIRGDSSVPEVPANLRATKNAEEARREKVRQQNVLHKKVGESTRNYNTCKF